MGVFLTGNSWCTGETAVTGIMDFADITAMRRVQRAAGVCRRRKGWPLLIACSMLVAGVVPAPAFAFCTAIANPPASNTQEYTLPTTLVVPGNTPVGGVIHTATLGQPGYAYADCRTNESSRQDLQILLVAPGAAGYWASGVSGLSWQILRGSTVIGAGQTTTIGPGRVSSTAAQWTIRLVKTSPVVGTGTVQGPSLSWRFYTSANTVVPFWVVNGRGRAQVQIPTCSVRGTTVALGNVRVETLASVGAASPVSPASNITLTCANGPRLSMRMSTQPVAGNTSVIPLTGAGRASGVGVQVMRDGAPVVYNQDYLVSANAGSSVSIPIAGRYYRTGAIVPGAGNSSATFVFTYQ